MQTKITYLWDVYFSRIKIQNSLFTIAKHPNDYTYMIDRTLEIMKKVFCEIHPYIMTHRFFSKLEKLRKEADETRKTIP